MCDSSKEPRWLTDHKSEEKMKNIEIWINDLQETLLFNEDIWVFIKQVFCSNLIFFLSLKICDQWIQASYPTLNSDDFQFWLYKGWILKNQN